MKITDTHLKDKSSVKIFTIQTKDGRKIKVRRQYWKSDKYNAPAKGYFFLVQSDQPTDKGERQQIIDLIEEGL